jgi:aconitase A
MLPLTFARDEDYKLIDSGDLISTVGLNDLLRGDKDAKITLLVKKPDGRTEEVETVHTFSLDQANWLRAGSCMNHIATTMS